MATAASTEELREAVLLCFGAGRLVFLIAHFVGELFHSQLISIARKTWIGWLARLSALVAGPCQPCCRNLSKKGQRDRRASWMPLFSIFSGARVNNSSPGPLSPDSDTSSSEHVSSADDGKDATLLDETWWNPFCSCSLTSQQQHCKELEAALQEAAKYGRKLTVSKQVLWSAVIDMTKTVLLCFAKQALHPGTNCQLVCYRLLCVNVW